MNNKDDTHELYQTTTEILGIDGVDSADFILDNATFIRIQVAVKGKIKVIPSDLIEKIAKLVREYNINLIKENKIS